MINNILRKLSSYLSIFFKNKPLLKSKNIEILEEINQRLINQKKKINTNLKKTHIKFNLQIYDLLKSKKIEKFLRKNFIQKMFFVHNRFFIYKELIHLKNNKNWKFYKKLLIEDDVGDPIRYFLYPKSSGNRINHVFHLSILIDEFKVDLKKIKSVFEFGAGYGCMARIFSKINGNIKYQCFDTFLVNLLQYYYLQHNKLNVGFSFKNNFFLNSNFNYLEKYNKKNFNYLFIANWSLSETPIKFRKKFETTINNSKYILISFQEKFENINNLNYFRELKNKISNNFQIKIVKNQFYNGNFIKKQNHFYFLGKKVK